MARKYVRRLYARHGLHPNKEDLLWLRSLEQLNAEEVPPFNKSRLIAMRLVEIKPTGVTLTEKGRQALA